MGNAVKMSQTITQLSVKKIENNLPPELKNPRILNDPDKIAALIANRDESDIAYLVEILNNVISKKIKKVERVKRNVFKNHRQAKISIISQHMEIKTRHDVKDDEFSHKIAVDIRATFGLPPLKGKGRSDAIRDIAGMLKNYVDNEENPVDAIKQTRNN